MKFCRSCGSGVESIKPVLEENEPANAPLPFIHAAAPSDELTTDESSLETINVIDLTEKQKEDLDEKEKKKKLIAAAIVVVIIIAGITVLNQEDEDTTIYVYYAVYCEDCGVISVDLTLPNGREESKVGIPDEDGRVKYVEVFNVNSKAIDDPIFAYIIAQNGNSDEVIMATMVGVDSHYPDEETCIYNSDMVYESYATSGSGGWFIFDDVINGCQFNESR
jgi:hypothetical protein